MANQFFLLKISLIDTQPLIWRNFVVPASIKLDHLHHVIQIVMGWENYHMYEFTIGKKSYAQEMELFQRANLAKNFHLQDLVKKRGQSFQYLYDFGDNWEHKITIEDMDFKPENLEKPIYCIKGEGMCPPEDIGGVFGFENFCEIMADPNHEEHADMKEWYFGDSESSDIFSVDYFNLSEVNSKLSEFVY
jgi:hypothetical protein